MPTTNQSHSFQFPAEWETHAATWIAWPHNKEDWPGKFVPIQWVYAEIARLIADSEPVKIIVKDDKQQQQVEKTLSKVVINHEHVQFVKIPTDRSWTRDCGPIFVKQNGQKTIIDFHFNGWAKYPNHKLDTQVAKKAAELYDLPYQNADVSGHDFVLEGGAIDVNGVGTVITTVECLLDRETQVRNPKLSQDEIEQGLKKYLDVEQVVWLNKGIVGDDTHGHVDDLCRFVNHHTVVLCHEKNENDENYTLLKENHERLQNVRLANGSKLEVIPLPMPGPVVFEGQRLPASYANFYITNHSILVPTFNDPNERIALGLLAELFPNRKVVGIHAGDLIWGLGAIHCLTQQECV